MDSEEHCRGRTNAKRCGAKIARYRRAVAAPTFTGFERQSKTKDPREVQFWFCPNDILTCVLGPPCKSILSLVEKNSDQSNKTQHKSVDFFC